MIDRTFPLSFAQQRLWFLNQLDPETPSYNLLRAIRIEGALHISALSRTLQTIADRHESLRTAFISNSGQPRQLVEPGIMVELPETDLAHLPTANRLEEVRRIASQDAMRAFDLSAPPLFRTRLIRLEPEVHVLVLVMHHIVTDGWSMSVLFREIAAIYQNLTEQDLTEDSPLGLGELPIQYPDFAQWQRKSVTGEYLDTQLTYWKNKLGGSPAFLELPTDRPRPAVQTHHGASRSLVIDPELTNALKGLSQREGATLFMILLAAFQVLLWRYTSAEDILIGTPIAGRSQVDFEDLIGLFVDTIIMRGDLSGDPSFVTLLRRVRTTALEAYDHQDTPLEKIVEELEPERSLSYTPLFQVMFVLQNAPAQIIELSNLKLEELEFESGLAKFDLTLEMVESDGGLCGTFEFSKDLFDGSTIERFSQHFENLLRSIVRNPDSRIGDLQILDSVELNTILVQWNETSRSLRGPATIHGLFEQQVKRTPEATALIEGTDRITFLELNRRANRIANYLLSNSLDPEAPVGVLVERSIDMVAALLGVLKAGHPYVPIDSSYPKQRIALMLENSRTPLVLTHRGLKMLLPDSVTMVRLDGDGEGINRCSSSDPAMPETNDQIAYVIFTSGSTGRPKGVEGTHHAAINRFEWMWRAYPFKQGETTCVKTALGFVDSVWEIFGPLLKGVCNVIIPNEILFQPERLVDLLNSHQVSRIVLVPSLLRVLLDQIEDLPNRLPKLRLWTTSGEALPIELARRWHVALPNATLLNLYGSSEVAADVTCEEVKDLERASSCPIGKPIDNVQIYIVDSKMRPVPIGVRGHIYAGGDCLARGYCGQPELTSERFVHNPFSSDPSKRLYKTGDLGRYLPDGRIEYLGRADNQVKLRGFRIELGEIETILNEHPRLREAFVTVDGQSQESQQLVAYVTGPENTMPGTAELRHYLKSRVPDYMVPSAFVALANMPLLPNGKVNRKALPPIHLHQATNGNTFVPARNETEARLASIWQDLLGIERIGINSNFFELGGHSLLGMQLLSRVRNTFEVELPVRCLFEEPTILGLGLEIEKARAAGIGVRAPIVSRRTRAVSADAILAELDKLPADQVTALLEKLLREKRTAIADAPRN